VDILAAHTERSKLPDVPTEFEGREAGIGDAGNSEGGSVFRIRRYIVQVVEPVVREGQPVESVIVDGQVPGEAKLRSAHDLLLDGVKGETGERRERFGVAIEAVALRPGERACQSLAIVDDVVDLPTRLIHGENGDAASKARLVVDQGIELRVRVQGEKL